MIYKIISWLLIIGIIIFFVWLWLSKVLVNLSRILLHYATDVNGEIYTALINDKELVESYRKLYGYPIVFWTPHKAIAYFMLSIFVLLSVADLDRRLLRRKKPIVQTDWQRFILDYSTKNPTTDLIALSPVDEMKRIRTFIKETY